MYDRAPRPGARFHGDTQGLENWSRSVDVLEELRTMGIATDFARWPRTEATFYDHRGRMHAVRTSRPLFYALRRGDVAGSLDRALDEQARAAGATIRRGERAPADAAGVVIRATGPRNADAIAVGYVFETDAPDAAIAIVDERLAPRGYSYLLVNDGHATLASCQFDRLRDWRGPLEETVRAFRLLAPFDLSAARFFSGYGNALRGGRLVSGNELRVGEAAGLQDALWGFGMRHAVRSGHLAAQSILTGESYKALVQREIMPHVRASVVDRLVWDHAGERFFGSLVDRVARHEDPTAFMGWGLGPMWIKDLLYPIARRLVARRRPTDVGLGRRKETRRAFSGPT